MIHAGVQTMSLASPKDSADSRPRKIRAGKKKAMAAGLSGLTRKKMEKIVAGAVRWQEPLADYTTLKVGGPAWAVVLPESREAYAAMVALLSAEKIPWWILGRGSNVLVPDEGLAGVVLIMGRRFAGISGPRPLAPQVSADGARKTDLFEVEVEAGCSLARLLRWAVEHELSGLEFTAGIPGSVGGAVWMNAGAWGREMADCVSQLTVMDDRGICREWRGRDVGFTYRGAPALAEKIVLAAVFQLVKSEKALIEDACQAIIHRRLAKQPLHSASAGSFFKNPASQPAGRLIEQAGLKGMRIGGAMISDKHANFLINTGGASAAEIYELMRLVQTRVYDLTGIMLEPEVALLGAWRQKGEKG